jgi:ADP-ribose pyrophosphatase
MNKPYQTLNQRKLYENPWYLLRQDDVILPNGEQTVYNVIDKSNAAWVVPILTDGRMVLINQYRYAIDDWCLEIPAGGIYGDADPEATARKELLEEIGGQAESLAFLGQFWTMNGIGNELGFFFLGTNVTLSEKPQHEATEVIELKIIDAAKAIAMAKSGQIADAPSALAILLCESRL